MPTLRSIAPTLAFVLGAACASAPAVPDDPEAAFVALERHLLQAPALLSISRLTSEGVFEADLRAEHVITRGGTGRVRVVGTFGGEPVELTFTFDGERMELASAAGTREWPQPSDVRGGLLLGMTRMGWLHNVALLVAGAPPDGIDGDVRELTRAVRVLGGDPLEVDGRERRALTFGVEVRGEVAATAVLWLDTANGRPLERWQKVAFTEGDMRVVETYEVLDLDPDLAALGLAP